MGSAELNVHSAVNSENPKQGSNPATMQDFHTLRKKDQTDGKWGVARAGLKQRGRRQLEGQAQDSTSNCGPTTELCSGHSCREACTEVREGPGTRAKDTYPCLMTLSSIRNTPKTESLAPNALGSNIKSLNWPASIPDESHRSCTGLNTHRTHTNPPHSKIRNPPKP